LRAKVLRPGVSLAGGAFNDLLSRCHHEDRSHISKELHL
jgi:hypothetical protein